MNLQQKASTAGQHSAQSISYMVSGDYATKLQTMYNNVLHASLR
jgi:hypothetical protein